MLTKRRVAVLDEVTPHPANHAVGTAIDHSDVLVIFAWWTLPELGALLLLEFRTCPSQVGRRLPDGVVPLAQISSLR